MHARTQLATLAAGLALTAGLGGVLAAAASAAPSSAAPSSAPTPVASTPELEASAVPAAATPSPSATTGGGSIEVPAGQADIGGATNTTPYGPLALIAVGTVLAGGGAVVAIRRRA